MNRETGRQFVQGFWATSLGTLASPFAPANYVLVSVLWLALFDRERFSPGLAAVAWLATSVPFLLDREGPFVLRALAFFPAQALAIGLPAYVLWTAGRRREAASVSASG
jgi:hypothetical protein